MIFDWWRREGKTSHRSGNIDLYIGVKWIPSREALPADLGKHIYVVDKCGKPIWAIMRCPCGCGDRIEANLMRSRRPYWRLRKHGSTISLFPSLWVTREKCGSHFFLIRNIVRWAHGISYQSAL